MLSTTSTAASSDGWSLDDARSHSNSTETQLRLMRCFSSMVFEVLLLSLLCL